MNTYSIYDINTGLFTGQSISCDSFQLPNNVPDGCSCILGEYDPSNSKVNVSTGEIEAYTAPVHTRPVEVLRNRVWERIKTYRTGVEAGGVKVGDYWFHSDIESRIKYLGITLMQIDPNTVIANWKTMTGVFVPMTKPLAEQILVAVAAHDINVFAVAEQHKAALQGSDTPLEYDYTIDWPDCYLEIDNE